MSTPTGLFTSSEARETLGFGARRQIAMPVSPRWIGKYEIVASLGEGGASEVFLARGHGPRGFVRTVVLKRLLPHRASDAAFVADFAREAQAYARLEHPAIVAMYEFFEHAGQPVLVLEYVDGLSLQALLTRLRWREQSLSDAAAFYVMFHVFSALASAHDTCSRRTGEPAYVVHRDVTPGNVLLGWNGQVKLTDFGIAKLAGIEADTRAEGLIKGTFGYMAPEQLLTKDATVRTDVYSACLLLRELLLGRETFVRGRESQVEFLERLAHPSLPDIDTLRAGLPKNVSEALRIGLRPDPEERDISAARIRDVLASCIELARARDELVAVLASVCEPRSAPMAPLEPPPPESVPTRLSLISAVSRESAVARPSPPAWPAVLRITPYAFIALLGLDLIPPAREAATRPLPVAPSAAPEPLPAAAVDTASTPLIAEAPPAPAPIPDSLGEIVTAPGLVPHRIFVDGRVLGETGASLRVRCGPHQVRIGSQGQPQRVEIPCGGSISVEPLW